VLDIRQRAGTLFAFLMIAQVLLISAQVSTKSGSRVLSLVTFEVFSRVQRAAAAGVNGLRAVWGGYFALRGVRAENESLRRQLADLQVRMQQREALAGRADRLQQLLGLRDRATFPTLAAEVIAGSPNPGMRTITIDRGSADGVLADMAVIAPAGVIGRIIGPTARHAARVQLLVDRNAAAGAIVDRVHAGGMVLGTESETVLRMDLVSNLADVRPGDAVIASGVDGIFPKGYAVGTVERSERGSGLYRTITVRPAADFSSLEDVLVVLVPPRAATRDEAVK
jgi:rod shape-determining protein MreC